MSFMAFVSMKLMMTAGAYKFTDRAVCHHSFKAPQGTNCPKADWVDAMVAADPRPGKTFMDVGCNKGNSAIKWMERWDMSGFWSAEKWEGKIWSHGAMPNSCSGDFGNFTAKVFKAVKTDGPGKPIGICVEPMKSTIDLLHSTSDSLGYGSTQFGDFRIVQAAVTDEQAAAGKIGHFRDAEPGTEWFGLHNFIQSDVPLKTVDGIMAENGIEKIDILLVDTEGGDPAVLRGAAKTLKSVRYLEFEVHRDLQGSSWSATSLLSVVDELDKQGFECYWAGNNGQVLNIKQCWNDSFERGTWANAACVKRGDIWEGVLKKFELVKTLV